MDLKTHRHEPQQKYIIRTLQVIVQVHYSFWVIVQPFLAERPPSNLGCDLDARVVYQKINITA